MPVTVKDETINYIKILLPRLDVDLEEGTVNGKYGTPCPEGYRTISLTLPNKKKRKFKIHHIVAIAGGLDLHNKIIDHKDANKANNKFSNLDAVTTAENTRRAKEMGLCIQKRRGSERPHSKLNEEKVRFIKEAIKNKSFKQVELARMFGVHQTTIRDIKQGKVWAWV